jgi:flagellar hook protein FlgE
LKIDAMINRIAVSGLNGSNHILRTLQDNISNVRSTAFKGERAFTLDAWQTPSGGGGAEPALVTRDPTQGPLQGTSNALDFALTGPGFFVTADGEEQRYTRAGNFSLSADGHIVSDGGYALLGYPGSRAEAAGGSAPTPLRLPAPLAADASLAVDAKGQMILSDAKGATLVGTVAIAKFPVEGGLQALSESQYGESAASGPAIFGFADGAQTSLQQRQLEQANVNLMDQLTSLIAVQNAFSAQAKSLSTYDEMIKTSLSDMR